MDKKIKTVAVVIMIYIICCIIRTVFPESLINEVKNGIAYEVEKGIISLIASNNIKMIDYYEEEDAEEETGLLYDVMGKSTGYLQYIRNENNNIRVDIYDPNIYLSASKDNTTDENIESTKENIENENIDNEKENTQDKETESTDNTIEDKPVTAPGILYSMEQLSDFNFLMNNMYVVTQRANLYKSDLVAKELLQVDLSIDKNSDSPQILIYHTHSHEGFVDTVGHNTSNIVAVGEYLAKVLSEQYGYNVIHCTESFDEVNGVFDRSKAYTYATPAIERILENNPSIEVVLDIHRDGLPEDSPKLVTTINGKATAKVMFFNGISRNDKGEISYLRNPYRHENLAMSFQMKLKALEMFPEYTRKNYIDAYMYNLHLRPRSMLVEVGAQTNTFEEAKNAMEPFAAILDEVLRGK